MPIDFVENECRSIYLIVSKNVFRSLISSGIRLKIRFNDADFLLSSWNASSERFKRYSTTINNVKEKGIGESFTSYCSILLSLWDRRRSYFSSLEEFRKKFQKISSKLRMENLLFFMDNSSNFFMRCTVCICVRINYTIGGVATYSKFHHAHYTLISGKISKNSVTNLYSSKSI